MENTQIITNPQLVNERTVLSDPKFSLLSLGITIGKVSRRKSITDMAMPATGILAVVDGIVSRS
jgi:hypothetical protein